ncbi:hypothetical protein HOLleu_37910 [Holothuria leucospilota]|uniref:Uncharacterized protein n=1 Tax=Holothuria leucospilota TaxID=206669 RepID=A0A9Q0YLL0_HOLLE|nr:hypothetical protein HOLleu_37910 [Holothuria leucospilota]
MATSFYVKSIKPSADNKLIYPPFTDINPAKSNRATDEQRLIQDTLEEVSKVTITVVADETRLVDGNNQPKMITSPLKHWTVLVREDTEEDRLRWERACRLADEIQKRRCPTDLRERASKQMFFIEESWLMTESVNGGAIYEDCDVVDLSIVTSSHPENTSNDLTSILKSHRRKRRFSDDINDDDDNKGMTSFLASVSILTPSLLPSKRPRRSTELRDIHHDDLLLGNTECQRHVTRPKRVPKKTRKQKTVRKISKEDIFAFIHNIRLEGTRAEELSNLMAAKCFLTAR